MFLILKLPKTGHKIKGLLLFQGPSGYPGERGIRGEPVSYLRVLTHFLSLLWHCLLPVILPKKKLTNLIPQFILGGPRSKGRTWREGFTGKKVPSDDAHVLWFLFLTEHCPCVFNPYFPFTSSTLYKSNLNVRYFYLHCRVCTLAFSQPN